MADAKALKSQVEQDIERAIKAGNRIRDMLQKPAPKGMDVAKLLGQDQRGAMVRRYVPDSIGPKATKTAFFDAPGENGERHRRHLDEGWVPVVEDGEQVADSGGDRLYWRPKEISDAHIRAASVRSAERLKVLEADVAEGQREGLIHEVENEVAAIR